jgi:hypothetical protein
MRSRRITPRIICPDRSATPASGASRMPGRNSKTLGSSQRIGRSPDPVWAISQPFLASHLGSDIGHEIPECSRPATASRRTVTSEASLPAGRLQTRQLHRAHQQPERGEIASEKRGYRNLCASAPLGRFARYEVLSKSVDCWETASGLRVASWVKGLRPRKAQGNQ